MSSMVSFGDCCSHGSGIAQIAVGAVFDNTRVEVNFPPGASVRYDNTIYNSNNPFVLESMKK